MGARYTLSGAPCRRTLRRGVSQEKIVVHGAREHNLKDISVEIPRDRLVVITGISGSGKSTLAFDTIFAEGQRRYVEVPLRLRPPVPGPDGEAGRRLHRRALPGHLHRPEGRHPQPPLHRGHGDRGLRLPAPPLRPGRHPPLPHLRAPSHGADRVPDGGHPGHPPRGDALPDPGPCGAGTAGGVPPRLRGRPQGRLRPGAGGRHRLPRGRGPGPGQVPPARHRGGGRPPGGRPGDGQPGGRLPGDGPQAGGRDGPGAPGRPGARTSPSASATPAPCTRTSPSSRSSPAPSPSTPPGGPARSAPGWAPPWRSTRSWCCPTGTSPSRTGRSPRGR